MLDVSSCGWQGIGSSAGIPLLLMTHSRGECKNVIVGPSFYNLCLYEFSKKGALRFCAWRYQLATRYNVSSTTEVAWLAKKFV